jgi:hypothetical protein
MQQQYRLCHLIISNVMRLEPLHKRTRDHKSSASFPPRHSAAICSSRATNALFASIAADLFFLSSPVLSNSKTKEIDH